LLLLLFAGRVVVVVVMTDESRRLVLEKLFDFPQQKFGRLGFVDEMLRFGKRKARLLQH